MTTPPHDLTPPVEPVFDEDRAEATSRTRAMMAVRFALDELSELAERIESIYVDLYSEVVGCEIKLTVIDRVAAPSEPVFGARYPHTIKAEVMLDASALRFLDPPLGQDPVAPSET